MIDNEAIVARYWLAREQAWGLCSLDELWAGDYLFLITFFEEPYLTLAEIIELCNRNGKTGEVYK